MGAFEEAKGKVKQAVGDVIEDPDLHREGQAQEEKGEAERDATQARLKAMGHEAEADAREAQQRAAQEKK